MNQLIKISNHSTKVLRNYVECRIMQHQITKKKTY